jgi:hypothetical protein
VLPRAAVAAVARTAAHVVVSAEAYALGGDQSLRPDPASDRVIVYAAHEPAVAEELRYVERRLLCEGPQLEAVERQALNERIGRLLGYPECCIQAFLARTARATTNGDQIRAALAATAGPPRWPLHHLLPDFYKPISHFPCAYDCAPSLAYAERARAAIARLDPEFAATVEAMLRRPVLYLNDRTQVVFDGRLTGPDAIEYTAAYWPSRWPRRTRPWLDPSFAAGARAALAAGRRVECAPDGVQVLDAGGRILTTMAPGSGAGFVVAFE